MEDRPNELTFSKINDLGFKIEKRCKLPELKCYEEDGSIYLWATIFQSDTEYEALQYLTPEIAMKMSKQLELIAIQAFKNNNK